MTAEIAHIAHGSLPAPSDLERIEISAGLIRKLFYRRHADESVPSLRGLLVDIDAAAANAPTLAAQLAALQRPATKKELADHLSVLRISFPNAKTVEGFARVLIERIAAREPKFGAVNWAVRHLIDRHKFMPSIAEVHDALDVAQSEINAAQDYVQRLPLLRAEIAEMIDGDMGVKS